MAQRLAAMAVRSTLAVLIKRRQPGLGRSFGDYGERQAMNLLHEIFKHEVYPALGCTEPISCAYVAAAAAAHLGEEVEQLVIRVDPGTFKNGAAVTIPHTRGRKGNLIAAALGAVLARPEGKLELLRDVQPEHLRRAEELYHAGKCELACLDGEGEFRIEARVNGRRHTVVAILAGGHTNIESIQKDGEDILRREKDDTAGNALAYRRALRGTALATLLARAVDLDADAVAYLRRGVEMNQAMSERGFEIQRTAHQLLRMKEKGYLADDIFFRVKLRVASAVDARMAGVDQAVMTSGGSGNQGIVATLTTYMLGKELGIADERIFESLAVAHLLNAYVKCFVGELSVVCGCAMAAGISAAVAIVYQQAGINTPKIGLAVNSVIGDLGGLICDGAKPGCAMKSVTAVDTAIRSGLMAVEDYGLTADDGLVGRTAEESIRNLGRITLEGMFQVDPTLLKILQEKDVRRRDHS